MSINYPVIEQYINGEWVAGDAGTSESILDPATGASLGELAHVSKVQLDLVLNAVEESAPGWADTASAERGVILRRLAVLLSERMENIAYLISWEQGKPLGEARGEVNACIALLNWCAEEGRRTYGRIIPSTPGSRLMVVAEPIGPVAAFTPWNFPIYTVVGKVAPALAAGCTIVVKASEETPGSVVELFRALHDAGVPAGVANLVFGVPADVSTYLLSTRKIRKLSLTGSIPVGRTLSHLAVDADVVTTMELGGNAPVIVEPDVEVSTVAGRTAASKFRNAGQVCNAASRFYVHSSVVDEFAAAATKYAQSLRVGPGTDPETTMGPLANARRGPLVQALVDDAVTKGAVVLTGGRAMDRDGNFFEPTVLRGVTDEMRIFSEEVFGPVMAISSYANADEAVQRANQSDYGLGAFVFTSSLKTARSVSRGLKAGMVGINTTVINRPESPFGGVRASGHGFENGIEGIEAYVQRKAILEHDPVFDGDGLTR